MLVQYTKTDITVLVIIRNIQTNTDVDEHLTLLLNKDNKKCPVKKIISQSTCHYLDSRGAQGDE